MMKTRYELEGMMLPVDKDERAVIQSGLGTRNRHPRWQQAPPIAAGVILAVVGLRVGHNKPTDARRLRASPAATARPHPTTPETSTTTVPETAATTTTTSVPETSTTVAGQIPSPADVGHRFRFVLTHTGYSGTCEAERIVTIQTLEDEMEIQATKDISDDGPNVLRGNVLDANYDFNRIRNGIHKKDWHNMKPGDAYTLMGDCDFTSPVIDYRGNQAVAVVHQTPAEIIYYDPFIPGVVLGCVPTSACQ